MGIRAFGAVCLVTAGMLIVAPPSTARAQSTPKPPGAGSVSGGIEAGGRGFVNSPTDQQRGKLEDYKDVPSGGVVEQVLLKYTPADSFDVYQFVGRQLFTRDQSVWLQLSRPSLFDFNLRWDRIPHTFSTDGRSLGATVSPGVYTLPAPRPDSNAWRAAPYLTPIRNQWDPVRLSLAMTPSAAWSMKAEYTRIAKSGDRPMGMAFGGSSNPSREILEPIDQTVHDVRLSQDYADRGKRFEVASSWDFSVFQNAIKSVQSDNPQQTADTPAAGAAFGRTSLTPNNSANTGTVTGALHLPASTRIIATAAHTWMKQDQPFVPNTSNTLLASAVVVPRASLGADVQTSVYSAHVSSRPLKNLTLSARLRSFDYQNHTAEFAMPALVISDRSLAAGDTTGARPFTKANSDLSATYRLPLSFSLSGGYAREKWTRDPEERNVAHTTENTPRASLDFTGMDWLMLRGSYSKGSRRGDGYTQTDAVENPDSRRFDEADRDRERVNLLATITPTDPLSFTLNWGTGHDAYVHSTFGLQSDNSAMVSGAFDWTPSERFAFGASYTREDFNNVIHQRYRTGSTPALQSNPTFDWVDNNTDKITTTFANFSVALVPGTLDAGGSFSLSDASFHVYTFNPLTPAAAAGAPALTASQLTQATAFDWPTVTQKLQPVTMFLRYLYRPEWAITARYQIETYNQNDFRTQNPSYVNGGAGSLSPQIGNYYFLGNYYQNNNPSWLTLTVTWNPAALPFSRGRSTL